MAIHLFAHILMRRVEKFEEERDGSCSDDCLGLLAGAACNVGQCPCGLELQTADKLTLGFKKIF